MGASLVCAVDLGGWVWGSFCLGSVMVDAQDCCVVLEPAWVGYRVGCVWVVDRQQDVGHVAEFGNASWHGTAIE